MKLAVPVLQQIVGHVKSNIITMSKKAHWNTVLHMVVNVKPELITSRM